MTRRFDLVAVAAALMAAGPSIAAAADPAPSGLADLRFFVGTWNCAHTVGDFSGVYTTTYASTLGGRWLRQTYDFPATATEPAIHAEYFIGYDDRAARFVRFGAHSNGMYFIMDTTSASHVGWSWEYLPGKNGTATWTKRSDAEYAVDGPSYPQNGTVVTEHHVCKKSS